jgi:hypothetical protein
MGWQPPALGRVASEYQEAVSGFPASSSIKPGSSADDCQKLGIRWQTPACGAENAFFPLARRAFLRDALHIDWPPAPVFDRPGQRLSLAIRMASAWLPPPPPPPAPFLVKSLV